MDFILSEEQQMIKKTFAEYSVNEIAPVAEEIDNKSLFSREILKKWLNLISLLFFFPQLLEG